MLAWLTLIVAALAGLFVFFQHHTGVLDAVSAGFTAAGVIGLLVALYVGAHKSRGQIERGPAILITVAVLTIAAGALWWFAPTALFGTSAPATSERPARPSDKRAVSVLIRKSADGKFIANGQINGAPADLLIDTGASTVMIRHSDAEKAGIDTASLSFTTPVQRPTAPCMPPPFACARSRSARCASTMSRRSSRSLEILMKTCSV